MAKIILGLSFIICLLSAFGNLIFFLFFKPQAAPFKEAFSDFPVKYGFSCYAKKQEVNFEKT